MQRSSQKAKGVPQDMWRANEFGDRPYIHAIGFNVNEYTKITRDSAYSMGGQRIPTYPVHEGGLDRYRRLWLCRRSDVVYPTLEEFYVAAPAQAMDKAPESFEEAWAGHADAPLTRRESRANTAVIIVQQALIATGPRHTAA